MNSLNRYSPYFFPKNRFAQNRIVVPPMASDTASSEGLVTNATLNHYRALASSETGILFAEYTFVHTSGRGEERQLGADSEDKIPGLTALAKEMKAGGALIGLQLVHVGGKTTAALAGEMPQSPSGIPVPVKGWTPDSPRAVSAEDIELWKEWFLAAARRAEKAGFDLVELHAAHGYGLNQWLSPLTNQRTDSYGGTIENRARLLLEIIGELKAQLPALLLAVRLPAQDHFPGGLSIQEMQWVVRELERLGVNLIDVSSGIGGWRRPEGSTGQGYLVADATSLKEVTNLPVIGVGGIESGDFVDYLLQQSKIDFAAVGRAILQNPQDWKVRNLSSSLSSSFRN